MMVYCSDCAFVRSSSDCFGGVGVSCKVAKVVEERPNPVQNSKTFETVEQKNVENKCPTFRKRRWWQILWANTNG